jgi:DNA repair protein RadC
MLKTLPKYSRPREKLIQRGAKSLSDAELLAVILRTGHAGKNVLDMAEELLERFQSFSHLLNVSYEDVSHIKGIGIAKYTQICAMREIVERSFEEGLAEKSLLDSSVLCSRYLKLVMGHYEHEVFACLLLDSQHQLLHYQKLFDGTLNSASVYPREVIKCVLATNAAAVIFAHNHPSGNCQPSQADQHITQRLKKALALIDVSVLDHIIVGSETYSMADHGQL